MDEADARPMLKTASIRPKPRLMDAEDFDLKRLSPEVVETYISYSSFYCFNKPRRRADRATAWFHYGMNRVTFGDDRAGIGVGDHIQEPYASLAIHACRRFNPKKIIISCPAAIFNVSFDEWKHDSASFHFGVGHANLPREFRSPALEPLEDARVIERTHLVRFAIANAQLVNALGAAHVGRITSINQGFQGSINLNPGTLGLRNSITFNYGTIEALSR
jgi:hypothetical protein